MPMNERTRTFLAVEARLSLENLALCRQVCALLRDYIARKLPPPQVCVQFSGKGDQPILIGDNCGFFTTPIVLTALVDIRKFTSFLGFKAASGGQIDRRTREKGDYDISDLGLGYPDRDAFLAVLQPENVMPAELEKALIASLTYANRVIAHFTQQTPNTEIFFNRIVLACFGIDRAMRTLIYAPLGVAYPDLRIRENGA
jgi:hypothetical protein